MMDSEYFKDSAHVRIAGSAVGMMLAFMEYVGGDIVEIQDENGKPTPFFEVRPPASLVASGEPSRIVLQVVPLDDPSPAKYVKDR